MTVAKFFSFMLSPCGATVEMYKTIYAIALKWVKKGTGFNLTWCYEQNSAFEQP
jgi:hypothetical protein